ncbi:MAG: hypothetical protein ABIV51_00200 [Saprospiraceae bacterium]
MICKSLATAREGSGGKTKASEIRCEVLEGEPDRRPMGGGHAQKLKSS